MSRNAAPTRLLVVLPVTAALVVVGAAAAAAQPQQRFYVGAEAGTFRNSADEVDGSSFSAGVLAGIAITPWLDAEVDVGRPASAFTRSYGGDALSASFAPAGSPREEIERFGVWLRYDKRRDVIASVSGAAIFHPSRGRIRPGLVLGVANHRVRDRTDYTPVRVGPSVDPAHPHARPRVETASHNKGGLTVGLNVAIAVSRHLAVVPDLRYDYGSIGDEINNALRATVRVLFRF